MTLVGGIAIVFCLVVAFSWTIVCIADRADRLFDEENQ